MSKRILTRYDKGALITREVIKNFYLLKYYNLYMNSYKFTGIDYQQKDFLLRKLWATGKIACFKLAGETKEHPQGAIVFCPFATSKLNIYDYPIEVNLIKLKAVNFIPSSPQVVDKDVVLGFAQRNKRPVLDLVDFLINKITDCEMTLRTALKAQKTPWLIGYNPENEEQRMSIKTNLDNDEPYLFLESYDVNQFKSLLSGSSYNCDKLYELKQAYENELREYLGINNLGVNEKKEHLIGAEINVNNEIIESSGECFLDELKEFCERIRNVLGYEISVELNKPDSLEVSPDDEQEEEVEDELQ